jgi:hypothetical protein
MFPSSISGWLFLLVAAIFLCGYLGWLPQIDEITMWLTGQPQVKSSFPDSLDGRSNALWFVLGFTFLSPLAVVAAVLVLWFVVAVVSGLVDPVVRGLRLPAWFGTAFAVLACSSVLYIERDAWVPGSIWTLGLIVRAYQVIVSYQ